MTETIDSDQCADLLRCTPEQVEELARGGELPALKFGRGWLFIRADLLSYLAEKARSDAIDRRAKRQPNATSSKARKAPPSLAFP